jgi:hypothetical protein
MVQCLDTTLGPSSANVSMAGEVPALIHYPAQVQHPTDEDMGTLISHSIVAAVQTLTSTTAEAAAMGPTNGNKGSKSTFSKDKVATLMGFAHVNSALKLPSFWRRVQASKKSCSNTMDAFRTIIMEDMKTWASHNRQEINKGIHFEEKMIDSIKTV